MASYLPAALVAFGYQDGDIELLECNAKSGTLAFCQLICSLLDFFDKWLNINSRCFQRGIVPGSSRQVFAPVVESKDQETSSRDPMKC